MYEEKIKVFSYYFQIDAADEIEQILKNVRADNKKQLMFVMLSSLKVAVLFANALMMVSHREPRTSNSQCS